MTSELWNGQVYERIWSCQICKRKISFIEGWRLTLEEGVKDLFLCESCYNLITDFNIFLRENYRNWFPFDIENWVLLIWMKKQQKWFINELCEGNYNVLYIFEPAKEYLSSLTKGV